MAKFLLVLMTVTLLGYSQSQGSSSTSTSSTTKSTTPAKTTEDPRNIIQRELNTLASVCVWRKSSETCATEKTRVETAISSHEKLDDVCDKLDSYTICMAIKCEADTDVTYGIRDVKKPCNGSTILSVSGLLVLLAAILNFL